MFRRFMLTTAAAALLIGSAAAQPTPQSNPAPPMQKQEPMRGERQFITQQAADQWLVSGTDVIGANNERIGVIGDILLDRNGRVVAYVIDVGGFLGIGTRHVALSPASFQIQPATDREMMRLRLTMTRDELKNAPQFKEASTRPAPTTGQAPPRDRAPTSPPAAPPVQR